MVKQGIAAYSRRTDLTGSSQRVASQMDTINTTEQPAVRHSPLQSLPSDILWAIHDCCRVKQVGYVLGCACKAFQPTEKTWERYAQRFTFTRHAVVTCKWSEWCRELRRVREPDMNGHSHAAHTIPITYQSEDGASKISPTPRFVLQIWSGKKRLTTTRLSFEQDVLQQNVQLGAVVGNRIRSRMAAGTRHLHQDDGQTCRHCQQMRSGEMVAESIGVRLSLSCKPLLFRVVALPGSNEDRGIAPTVVHFVDFRYRCSRDAHREFLQECTGPVATIRGDDELRGRPAPWPQDSATWGLVNHHADLVLYPMGSGEYTDKHDPRHGQAACVMRILRDPAGAATELMIEEFNWEFPASEIGGFRLNRVGVRRHRPGYDYE